MSMTASVTAQDLANANLLAALPQHALERLASTARVNRYKGGQVIFREGDPGESLHIVRSGLVKILHIADKDRSGMLASIEPGGVFGELAVLDPAPRSASAMAIDVSETIEVDKAAVEEVLDRDPVATRRMLGSLARSLTLAKEQLTQQNQILDQKVRERTAQLRETQLEVIRRLGQAAEYRDDDTGLHIHRMSRIAAKLADAAGLSDRDCELLLHAAPMHDIGKIGIADSILLKPGPLNDDEWAIMRSHTTIGAELLSGSDSEVMQMAQVIALSHHEKWDGSGYPNGLKEEAIPLLGRICCLADVFDALTSERPYKKAWTVEEAAEEIKRSAGSHFDPHLAEIFSTILPDVEELLKKTREQQAAAVAAHAGSA
jgi:HD-GYP domain-containing protein (c-di-GMP phosphodiesterase class II)